jgi:hypothetical protein
MNDPAAKIRVLYSVPEAMALLNLSRTQIYDSFGLVSRSQAHKPEGLEHDDESPPDQGLE